jgi:hypothetical protein
MKWIKTYEGYDSKAPQIEDVMKNSYEKIKSKNLTKDEIISLMETDVRTECSLGIALFKRGGLDIDSYIRSKIKEFLKNKI